MPLLVLGVGGMTGLLWHLNREVGGVVVFQSTRMGYVDAALSDVWQTDKDQYQRIDRNKETIGDNEQQISVLDSRVDTLEKRLPYRSP